MRRKRNTTHLKNELDLPMTEIKKIDEKTYYNEVTDTKSEQIVIKSYKKPCRGCFHRGKYSISPYAPDWKNNGFKKELTASNRQAYFIKKDIVGYVYEDLDPEDNSLFEQRRTVITEYASSACPVIQETDEIVCIDCENHEKNAIFPGLAKLLEIPSKRRMP